MKKSAPTKKQDLASRCRCGFDFAKARLKKRPLNSYVLLPEKRYQQTIRREYAITVEKNSDKRLRMIGRAAMLVGMLNQCPECGEWTMLEPRKDHPSRLRNTARS